MPEPAIVAEELSKAYVLGVIGRHTLQDEVRYWWHRLRGRNPREHMGRIDTANCGHGSGEEQNPTFWALKDVSCSVQPGEVVGVIGRNGAGKSTLLKILSRITEPTSGEAFINGRVGSLLEVGTGFHPELTGRENVYMNGTILGMKKREIDAKFDEIVGFAEIEKFIDTPVKRYSSGMYVRLAFAVAAHLEPEILLVDEVLAVGDMEFQKKCLGKMQDVSESGRTILFVSHNMPAITRLCSRAILLEQGRLVMQGTAEEVVAHYMSVSLGASASREWTLDRAPGENGFGLRAVRVVGHAGIPVSTVNVVDPFRVELAYRTANPGMRFRCTISFYTQGVCAFVTLEPQEQMHEQPGEYVATVNIPANLLAEGEYIIGVSVFASRGKKLHYCRVSDTVAFQVTDSIDGHSARGDYAEGLGGVMRPRLAWKKEYRGTSGGGSANV